MKIYSSKCVYKHKFAHTHTLFLGKLFTLGLLPLTRLNSFVCGDIESKYYFSFLYNSFPQREVWGQVGRSRFILSVNLDILKFDGGQISATKTAQEVSVAK